MSSTPETALQGFVPMELMILLSYGQGIAYVQAPPDHITITLNKLEDLELIKTVGNTKKITERGAKLIKMLAETPLPKLSWEDPRNLK